MTKIAINGFGRIGRLTFRKILNDHQDLEIAAINDLGEPKVLAHLLKYDSVYGIYDKQVKLSGNNLMVDGKKIAVLSEPDPSNLPWKKLGADIVLECTGVFRDKQAGSKHLKAGAKKVIISAPSKSADIPVYVLGVNDQEYDAGQEIVSMGSCTTGCLGPIAKVLDEKFGIVKGFMTTVHSYTNDQRILDLEHQDLRRARAAGLNIIPTTTGAAKTVERVLPNLAGKLQGLALRVPVPTVSIVDFVVELKKQTTVQEVNRIFNQASQSPQLKGILAVETVPLVSSDYIGNSYSSIIDLELTQAFGNLIKVLAWYDNEWGYCCRLAEFADLAANK